MKNIKIFIELVVFSLLLLFTSSVLASSEEVVKIKLSDKVFSWSFTEIVGQNYNLDNILYITNEEDLKSNYITYKNRVASELSLYHRNQNTSLVSTWDSFLFLCSDGKLWVNDYIFDDVWLNFQIENKNFFLKIKCSIDDMTELLQDWKLFDFKEKDISTNNNLQPYSLSSQYGTINEDQVMNSFLKPNPTTQPTFIDIVFLQIKTINSIVASLNVLWIETDDLFANFQVRNFYNTWLKKYSLYTNKQVFVDSFQNSVTLKDIWIANEIVEWLSKRLLCEYKELSICSNIQIQFSKKWEYEFYTLDEIIDWVFSDNKIIDILTSLYLETKKMLGGFENIWNPWAKDLINTFMEKTYWTVESIDNLSDYSIWYWLQTRIENIALLKEKVNNITEEKMNILGVYNFYFEMNNILKWQNKAIEINTKIDSDELKELVEWIIIKQNIEEKGNVLWDESEIYTEDIWYKIQKDILNIFNLNDKDVIFEFICGNIDGYSIVDYLRLENINTYEDYYNVLWWLIEVAYDEMNIIDSSSGESTYVLSFNMSHMRNTKYEEYFVIDNDCIFISEDLSLVLWYDFNSMIYNTDNIIYITDHSSKNNIGYKSLYPLSEMPVIENDAIVFSGASSLKVFNTQDINLWTFDKRTIEIDFTTYDEEKTQVLYDEWNHLIWINVFIKDSKLVVWAWNTWALWNWTFLTANIEKDIPYKVKLVLDAGINGSNDGFRMYLDSGNGYIKKWQWFWYSLPPHYLTRIWRNTRTRNNEDCSNSCVWNREDNYYFYGEIRNIKIWNAIR